MVDYYHVSMDEHHVNYVVERDSGLNKFPPRIAGEAVKSVLARYLLNLVLMLSLVRSMSPGVPPIARRQDGISGNRPGGRRLRDRLASTARQFGRKRPGIEGENIKKRKL